MKRDRQAELHFYEWRMSAWSLSETRDRLDATGRGIYRELLDCCYAQGVFPDDPAWICRRCACTPEQLAECWPTIESKFPKCRENYRHNVHADIVRKEYVAYVEKQRKNRKGKAKEINEFHDGGRTVVERWSNGGSFANKPNGNGNGDDTATATTNGKPERPTRRTTVCACGYFHEGDDRRRCVCGKVHDPSTATEVDPIEETARLLAGYVEQCGLPWEPPDEAICRQTLDAADGSLASLFVRLRFLLLDRRKRPSQSYGWFPVAVGHRKTA